MTTWLKMLQFIVAAAALAYAPTAGRVFGQNPTSEVIRLKAIMQPSQSNFVVDASKFETSDKRICTAESTKGCMHNINGGMWDVYEDKYLLQGTMRATDETSPKSLQLRADLIIGSARLAPN